MANKRLMGVHPYCQLNHKRRQRRNPELIAMPVHAECCELKSVRFRAEQIDCAWITAASGQYFSKFGVWREVEVAQKGSSPAIQFQKH